MSILKVGIAEQFPNFYRLTLCCVYVCVKSLKTDGRRANEKRNLTFTKISGETNSCNKMQSGVEKEKITILLNNKC